MPVPPVFPFRRTGRVIYSSRGLYGGAVAILVLVALIGTVVVVYAEKNSPATIVLAWCFLGVLLAMAGWCIYCGRRVRLWEREYERVTGHRFSGSP
ncbi:hypothetical protein SRABI98_00651 [Microbacterium sp. Bi98]|uniref:hypothetical protein n=1 Tax=unclassified Microbacterium TaxID=2609290 RepID=UPI000A49DFC4|nr:MULTISPECIES: hypothetical protein [unclassified Microbacterium]CAH0145436.1 hypothetical protein SRABI98_00651 [Microbacterium sp. Bi98]